MASVEISTAQRTDCNSNPGAIVHYSILSKRLYTQHTQSPVRKYFSPKLKYCKCFVIQYRGVFFRNTQVSNAIGTPGVKVSMSS